MFEIEEKNITGKNLLIYYHGFGKKSNDNDEFQCALAQELNAYLYSPSSDMPSGRSRGGNTWYPITKDYKQIISKMPPMNRWGGHHNNKHEQFYEMKIIEGLIDNNYDNIFLAGRSSGGVYRYDKSIQSTRP